MKLRGCSDVCVRSCRSFACCILCKVHHNVLNTGVLLHQDGLYALRSAVVLLTEARKARMRSSYDIT